MWVAVALTGGLCPAGIGGWRVEGMPLLFISYSSVSEFGFGEMPSISRDDVI
jgi:hypothetical protein